MPRYAMVVVADANSAEDAHELLIQMATPGDADDQWQAVYVGAPLEVDRGDEYATVGLVLSVDGTLFSVSTEQQRRAEGL